MNMDRNSDTNPADREQWFRSIFEHSPDPTWILENNLFVECNLAAVSCLGYENRDDLLSLHPSQLSPLKQPDGEDSYAKAERMMAVSKSTGLHRFEWVYTKANGLNFIAEVTLSPLQLAHREVIYCVWRDITERKIEEQSLLRSEAQQAVLTIEIQRRTEELEHTVAALATTRSELETILANAWIGVVQVNDKRVIVRTNRHFEQDMFGYEKSEMLGHNSSILYPSLEAYETIGRNAYPSLICGKPFSMLECTCRRKDGTTFLAQIVGSLTDPADVTKGSIWLFSDITEQKQAEERLNQTLSELEIIFQNPSVGIIYTVDRRIIRANRTFEKISNRSCEELIGQTTRFFYESDAAYLAAGEKIELAFAAGEICRLDVTTHDQDGNKHTYELFGSIVDPDDPQRRSIWLFTDVTQIRRMQSKLRDAKEATERAAEAIREKSEQIASLLDNSGQGFLSFGYNLIIESAFSRACITMLGGSPAGRNAADVFFPNDQASAEFFRSTITSVSSETDPCIRDCMLSLLPNEIARDDVLLKAEYKCLDNGKFMAVLTDVTAERRMTLQLRYEQRRQEMIVKAVSDSHNFFDAIEGFKTFLYQSLPGTLSSGMAPSAIVKELYREIHTYKGLFNQFSFPDLPGVLHAVESELSDLLVQIDKVTRQLIDEVVLSGKINAQFLKDIDVLAEALGEEFLAQGESVFLSVRQARQLGMLATHLLEGKRIDTTDPAVIEFLSDLGNLGKVSLKTALLSFNRLVAQIAGRLDKSVDPVIVTDDSNVFIDPQVYQPFLRSLAHVFRNAVTHGIEKPEVRWELDKNESGKISCHIALENDSIVLSIEDDGAGINIDLLRQRIVDAGIYSPEEVLMLSENDLIQMIFFDRITTMHEVNEMAGRGVGLASVLQESRKIGGQICVTTTAGRGTKFVFILPQTPNLTTGENG